VQKLCKTCSNTTYKIVPLTNVNKYLHNDTSETEVNINIGVNKESEKFYKIEKRKYTAPSGKLIIAVYA